MCTQETRQQHLLLTVVGQSATPISLTEAWGKMSEISEQTYGDDIPATTPYAPATLFKRAAEDGYIDPVGVHRFTISRRGARRIREIEKFFLEPLVFAA